MSVEELKASSEAKAKTNKAAAVRVALFSLGYPKKDVGKPEVEAWLGENKIKHKFDGNALSVSISGGKKMIDKAGGAAPKKKGKGTKAKATTKRTPTKVTSYDEAAKLLMETDEDFAIKMEMAKMVLDKVGGDTARAKHILKG